MLRTQPTSLDDLKEEEETFAETVLADTVEKSIINIIKNSNAQETLSSNGWPRSFSPTLDKCPLCDVFLSPLSKKKRRSGGDHCLLISTEHILEIDVFTKQCKLCFIVFKPDTLSMGLVNIGDLTLVTVDIFFTLQNTIR